MLSIYAHIEKNTYLHNIILCIVFSWIYYLHDKLRPIVPSTSECKRHLRENWQRINKRKKKQRKNQSKNVFRFKIYFVQFDWLDEKAKMRNKNLYSQNNCIKYNFTYSQRILTNNKLHFLFAFVNAISHYHPALR